MCGPMSSVLLRAFTPLDRRLVMVYRRVFQRRNFGGMLCGVCDRSVVQSVCVACFIRGASTCVPVEQVLRRSRTLSSSCDSHSLPDCVAWAAVCGRHCTPLCTRAGRQRFPKRRGYSSHSDVPDGQEISWWPRALWKRELDELPRLEYDFRWSLVFVWRRGRLLARERQLGSGISKKLRMPYCRIRRYRLVVCCGYLYACLYHFVCAKLSVNPWQRSRGLSSPQALSRNVVSNSTRKKCRVPVFAMLCLCCPRAAYEQAPYACGLLRPLQYIRVFHFNLTRRIFQTLLSLEKNVSDKSCRVRRETQDGGLEFLMKVKLKVIWKSTLFF